MHNSLLHLLLKNGDSLNTDILQGSVATRLGFGGVLCIRICYKFPAESNSERILKIGQYLVKLWARVRCLVFLTHSVADQRRSSLSPSERPFFRPKLIARSTIDMPWRNFLSADFGAKFQREVPLYL